MWARRRSGNVGRWEKGAGAGIRSRTPIGGNPFPRLIGQESGSSRAGKGFPAQQGAGARRAVALDKPAEARLGCINSSRIGSLSLGTTA